MLKLKSEQTIIVITFFIIVITIVVFFNSQDFSQNFELSQREWEYKLGDAPTENLMQERQSWQSYQLGSHLTKDAEKFDYLWLRVKLPDASYRSPVLYLKGVDHLNFPYQVYVKDNLIFKNGNLTGELKVPEFSHKIVNLPENYAGKYLYIKIYNKKNNIFVSSELLKFKKSYQQAITEKLFKNTIRLCASSIYLIVGLVIILIYLFYDPDEIVLYLGMFICSAFIFTLNYNAIPHLLFSNFSYGLYISYYFNVFFIVGVFFFYLAEFIYERYKLFNLIGNFYFIKLLLAIIFYFIKPHSVLMGSKIYNISLFITLIIAIYYIAKFSFSDNESKKLNKDEQKMFKTEVRTLGMGFIGLGLNVAISLIYAYSSEYQFLNFIVPMLDQIPLRKSDFVSLGIFYFIVILLYVTAKRFFDMKELAVRDSLTNLYDHGYFQEMLKHEVERAQRYDNELSLLLLDMDDFKSVNDQYGHQAGDEILSQLAKLLKSNVRSSDIVARYGGEEFIIVLINTGADAAVAKAGWLKEEISNLEVEYQGNKISRTVSIGVANYTLGQSSFELINQADDELYHAKNSGKNCISYQHQICE
ncbi:MAG: GGDEF domain-containing protein [Bacillota bacterium]